MDIGLQEFYRRIQLAPAITTFLPEEIGKGEIKRISTNNGYQASSWDLVYDRETEVNGMVREGFRACSFRFWSRIYLLECVLRGVHMDDKQRLAGRTK